MFSCLSKTCLIENNFDKMNTTRGGWLKERKKKKRKNRRTKQRSSPAICRRLIVQTRSNNKLGISSCGRPRPYYPPRNTNEQPRAPIASIRRTRSMAKRSESKKIIRTRFAGSRPVLAKWNTIWNDDSGSGGEICLPTFRYRALHVSVFAFHRLRRKHWTLSWQDSPCGCGRSIERLYY